METKPNRKSYNIASIVCGSWFLLTGWLWVYFMNLFVSYPVGLLGIFFWYRGWKIDPDNKLNKTALIIHIAGLSVSVVTLVVLLFTN